MRHVFTKVFLVLILVSGCQTSNKIETKAVEQKNIQAALNTEIARTSKPKLVFTPPSLSQLNVLPIEALNGKSNEQVKFYLGKPDFLRVDPPAELWQYRHKNCSLDLFFYPRSSSLLRIDFLDVRNFGGVEMTHQDCFNKIMKTTTRVRNRR